MLDRLLFGIFLLLCALLGPARAANFTFDYGAATQCDNFPVSWTGGNGPFELTLVPVFAAQVTYQIPSVNYSNGKGTYDVQLPFPTSFQGSPSQFVAVMSDSSGFASGGISKLITVGQSVSNAHCNATLNTPDFLFETPNALAQCDYYEFSNYTNATLPVTVIGLIPGGTSFALSSGNQVSFQWLTDVASGMSIIFVMTDSEGRLGGSSGLDTVGPSAVSTCLTGNYPSSVSASPSNTASSTSTSMSSAHSGNYPSSVSSNTASSTSTSTSTSTSSAHSSASTATIAAAVVASVLGVLLASVAAWFIRRRRHAFAGGYDDDDFRPKRQEGPVDLSNDSAEGIIAPTVQPYPLYAPSHISRPSELYSPYNPDRPYDPYVAHAPSACPHLESDAAEFGLRAGPPPQTPGASSMGDRSSTTTSSKAVLAGLSNYSPPSARFVVHTDAEQIIELPPQYSDLHSPSTIDSNTYPQAPRPVSSGSGLASDYLESIDQRASQSFQQPLAPNNTASAAGKS